MATLALQKKVLDQEHIVIVGAGFNGLACALEAQKRRRDRQVDIVAQTFLTDPHPMSWTTYLSRCFFGCLKTSGSNLEQSTFNDLLEKFPSSPGIIHRFPMVEYFSMKSIDENRVLKIDDIQDVPEENLAPGAQHGATFTTVSVSPIQLAIRMQNEFTGQGGRLLRGTVRHLSELAVGGVSSFQKCPLSEDPIAPTAIVICVGIGARFIGGLEDNTIKPARIHVVRIRTPAITTGRAFYDGDGFPSFFMVPLGNGDAILGGEVEHGNWHPKAARLKIDAILAKALSLCPDMVPLGTEHKDRFDPRSLVVWEGCDTFGERSEGPRLETQSIYLPDRQQKVPIILSYGYGASELQTHREVARITIDLLEAAIVQERQP